MTGTVLLIGILADHRMLELFELRGVAEDVSGSLGGQGRAGIDRARWPVLIPGTGSTTAIRVEPNTRLLRYCAVMGIAPGPVLGIGNGAGDGPPQAELSREIARQIINAPDSWTVEQIAKQLHAIGAWAGAQLRGAENRAGGGDLVSVRNAEDVHVIARKTPYSGFFNVEVCHLRHRTHAGGMTPVLRREVMLSGDAVVLLPWDPVRDRVLLIEQFRIVPLLRNDRQPWLLEAIAGRIDAGELVEEAARREAHEEANLTIRQMFPAPHHYPSPGALGEFLYLYIGIADLPDGIEGVYGHQPEAEDIRGHLVDRAELTRMALSGQLMNGPLLTIALWLELRRHAIRAELGLP